MRSNFSIICSGCHKLITFDQLLNDPQLKVLGMAYKDSDKAKAYFFFHHDMPECGTTMLIDAEKLASITNNIDFRANPHRCGCGQDFGLKLEELDACHHGCDITPYKDLLKQMEKNKHRNTK